MKIKTYFTQSVQEAMERARVELGPEAMLMNSKKTDPELRHLGGYEVVFAVSEPANTTERAAPRAPAAAPNSDLVIHEIAELRKQIENVKRSVSRNTAPVAAALDRKSVESEQLLDRLSAAGFSRDLAGEIVEAVDSRVANEKQRLARHSHDDKETIAPELIDAALIEEIESRFTVTPELGSSDHEPRIVMLVGPPGCGKTTTLVKLALKYGLASRTPLQILSTDTLRVGGSETLAAYARILGVGYQAVHSPASLGLALEEYRAKKLLLIDTPGFGPGNLDEASELTQFVSQNRRIEVQLILPAVLRLGAALRAFDRFSAFQPAKLLFTHLDEAETLGAVLELAMKTSLPMSYLTTGQQIPEDIEEASKPRLTERLSDFVRSAALSAA
jgi:flagellar biosynthesis protein FlhF